MHPFAISHDPLENCKVTNRPLQGIMGNGAKAGPVTTKLTAQSRLESPWSKSSHILNNVSLRLNCGIETQTNNFKDWICRSTCITKCGFSSIRFSRNFKRPNDWIPNSFCLAEPPEFWEKTILARFIKCFKAAKPRDTFHLSSASLRPSDYSTQVLISTKSPSLKSTILQSKKATQRPLMDWVT